MIEKKAFLLFSLIVVILMYLIPYLVLSGVDGPSTFIFWTGLSIVYLIFVAISMRR